MIDVRIAAPTDAHYVDAKKVFFDNPNVRAQVQEAVRRGIAYTFVLDGKPVAIVGYEPIHSRAGEVWGFIAEEVRSNPIIFHKKINRLMLAFVRKYDLKRLQIVVKSEYSDGIRWALALGFNREGTMRSYGYDGSDYVIMGRVF